LYGAPVPIPKASLGLFISPLNGDDLFFRPPELLEILLNTAMLGASTPTHLSIAIIMRGSEWEQWKGVVAPASPAPVVDRFFVASLVVRTH